MSVIKKGDILWIGLSQSTNFDPKNNKESETIWTLDQIKEHVIPLKGEPERYIKVKVLEPKGWWKKRKKIKKDKIGF